MFEVALIKDSELATLSDIWNQILNKSENDNVFLTWEWISTWWRHFGEEKTLLVLLFKKDGNIIGIAPLMYRRQKQKFLTLGTIEFIGTGLSDYGDFILIEDKKTCIGLIFNFLEKQSIKWDIMDLRHMPEDSDTAILVQKVAEERGYQTVKRKTPCMYVPLSLTWNEYYEKLSKKFKKNLRRIIRKCEKTYSMAIKHVENTDDIESDIQDFFDLYSKWLRERYNLSSIFDTPLHKIKLFLKDISYIFFKNDWLDLSFITIDQKPASSCFSFIYDKTYYCYLMPWDSFYSEFELGNLHFMSILEFSIKQGLKEFDLLRGDENYKMKWRTLIKNNTSIFIFRKNLKGKILHFLSRYIKK